GLPSHRPPFPTRRSSDLNNIGSRANYATGLNTLAAAAAGLVPGLPAAYFSPIANAIIPDGPDGVLCTSDTDTIGLGSFGGNSNRSEEHTSELQSRENLVC